MSPAGTSRQCRLASSRGPLYTSSRANWADDATGKSFEVASFLNVSNKRELGLVEWVTRSTNERNKSENEKVGGCFSRNA